MKRVVILSCMLFGCLEKNHAQENLFFFHQGKEVIQEARSKQPKTDVNAIPGYKDPSMVPQTSINEDNIDQRTQEASTNNEEAAFLVENSKVRPRLDIDPTTDPMFTQADEALTNSEKILVVGAQEYVSEPIITRHQCTKGYDLIQKKCRWVKVHKKTGVRKEEKKFLVYLSGKEVFYNDFKGYFLFRNNNFLYQSLPYPNLPKSTDPLLIKAFKNSFHGRDELTKTDISIPLNDITSVTAIGWGGKFVTFREWMAPGYWEYIHVEVTTQIEVPVFEFESVNNCGDLGSTTDQGNCEYTSKQCVEGPSTKIIEGVPVYSDCWAEEAIYQCRTKEEDKCKSLLQKGCYQINSQCVAYLEESHCIRWQQTYECQEGTKKLSQVTLKGDRPFCLDGSCFDQTWQPNGDMANALSKLAIFKEMQKDLNAKEHVVFTGKNLGCSRVIGDFKDCCKLSGWGKDIKLASCNEEEQELQVQRKLNKCHLIGTYCADRVLGVCTRKKTTYCCYNSKLSKLVNVQGKQQSGLSFGSAEHPDCEGLTLDQLTRIDFSKLDLSELFTGIFANLKTPNTTAINKDIQKSLANKTYMINDKKNKMTQGRQHGNF